ncbi:MAG TPA: FeoA family protein [Steroidobacteraceae bacterium]|nr:FeoA family protein [Steroidobacteraceae bacterium]
MDIVRDSGAGSIVAAEAAGPVGAGGPRLDEVATGAAGELPLADLQTGAPARVVSVSATDGTSGHPGASGGLSRRLAELGFLPGETLRIVARGFLGREPIAVRIGTGTFALRLFEAACIRVCPEHQPLP